MYGSFPEIIQSHGLILRVCGAAPQLRLLFGAPLPKSMKRLRMGFADEIAQVSQWVESVIVREFGHGVLEDRGIAPPPPG
jgi:hypothetical protein